MGEIGGSNQNNIEVDSGENNDSYNLDYAIIDLIISEIIHS